jgi:PAS domain S-box-containing protein
MFRQLFELSTDAMFLSDPCREVFVDCNQAAIEMMRASSKEQLLMMNPADLSPEFQPDGRNSRERVHEDTTRTLTHGSHRFEWWARRMEGEEFPVEVLLTPIHTGDQTLIAAVCRDITQRKASEAALRESEEQFRELFETSADAISLLDPLTRRFLACNESAVRLTGASGKNWILSHTADALAPELQPDGRTSTEVIQGWIERSLAHGTQRFEWMARRINGEELPMEILLTPTKRCGSVQLIVVARDISKRKKAERELLELTQALERKVNERTAELSTSEARFRALVEHAPEAIVVYSVDTGRFLFGNQHACDLYGVTMSELPELSPADVSPEFQPCGRRTSDLVTEKVGEVMAGGISVFEWVHQQTDGRPIPTEVRLLRLPAEGQTLIRASIIDNTDRKRAEQALRESEAKFRALFEGTSNGVVLMDRDKLLEVNPAAVRILGRRSADEMVGKHPSAFSPLLQPNGVSSQVMAQRYIEECIAKGSLRLEWMCASPEGREIPLEVLLTRIEWSGRQVIQACISDITERKQAERALRESEARFSAAFRASALCMTISRLDDRKFVLANEAFLKWSGYRLDEVVGRNSQELGIWADSVDRERVWDELRRTRSVRERECRMRNRHGKLFTMLVSSDAIEIEGTTHLLTVGLDITERKRAQAALAESEARFSAAFNSSPIMTGITRASDGRFVLVNDAALNWIGCSSDEVLGHTSVELGLWEDPAERARFWGHLQTSGSAQPWECQLKNRHGKRSTMLASGVKIEISGEDHLLVMMVDISERKKTEAELQASEARLRESENRFILAFEASPMFITILRLDNGNYIWANDAFVNQLGYSRQEVLGRASPEFKLWVDPSERESVWETMRTVGSVRQKECRWLTRAGEPVTILLSAEIIKFQNAPHVLSLALDITQRKRAEVELLKALEREKELSQLKSNFVSMVSHEFRTPLGIIQSSAELLRDFLDRMPLAERREQLDSISKNTHRMAGMMEEVLVLSRLEAGKLDFQPAPLDLNLFYRRIVDEVLSATSRRCSIELALNSIPAEAQADERLLGYIFTNLLSNAVKYSEAGTAVHFFLARDGRDAVCVIRDKGIGIPPEDQRQLFSAFHRGSNVGTRPGTGLGLLLVKRCADLHGGKVQLESQLGEGTTVTVRFPAFANKP